MKDYVTNRLKDVSFPTVDGTCQFTPIISKTDPLEDNILRGVLVLHRTIAGRYTALSIAKWNFLS